MTWRISPKKILTILKLLLRAESRIVDVINAKCLFRRHTMTILKSVKHSFKDSLSFCHLALI